ncbi:hypothetical protein N7539_005354 [Penicillium diatomitis]|uniref:Involucrin repeat protein n=1 Tax=Penicillium diatomitis TaxID=2819901 RepID=A0A9W9X749_9EURO|nr:uncharacterized protein N7539_005354 [Penicillium diatomitis]KAJ5485366.1 hypothetical protein N7539_005354 [Penicillium diatomitis]
MFHGQPSLADSPELSADTERNERDSSGLAAAITGAVTATGGMILADKVLHQRPRSRSTSPPGTERALGLEHKSHSRPSSPRMAGDLDQSLTRRRASMARSVTESPTAVPLHFRRPPTSPGLSRAVSVPPSATGRDSPTSASPTQTRHRRPNSVEFRTSREIRPLWLVDRYGTSKGDLVEPGEDLPSLPSSKSSSRSPSFDNLQSLQDDGMHSWEPRDDTAPSMMQGRKPSLTISTSRANDHVEGDLLDSQQATPTAGDFGGTSPGVKKSKPTYEFHSPSELLQNPEMFPEVPAPSLLENLPSAEGSVAGDKDVDEPQLTTDEVEPPQANQSSEGVGFANVADAAVSAAVEDHDQPIASTSGDAVSQNIQEEPRPRQDPERSIETAPHIAGFASLVSAAVAAKDSNERSLEESVGEPGTAIEEPDSKLPNIESLSKPESDPVGEQLPETTGTVTQPLEPATTESAIQEPNSLQQEPSAVIETVVTQEPSTASSSKKKKKKKGKKGQSAVESEPAVEPEEQSIAEPAPSAPTTVNELPDNGSQMPEANAVVTPENNEVPTSESAVLPAEPSRDITSDLPDPTADSTDPPMPEARAPAETTEVPEPTIDATIDPVTLPESAQDTPVDTVEPESNLTPAQKRKAKKAAKKKGKNSIASETTEAAAEEIKPSQDSLEPNTQAVEAVPEIEASVPQPASELDTEKTFEYDEAVTTPAESAARDAEQIENIVDTDQLEPSQDLSEVAEELPKDVEVPLAPLLPEEVVGQAETTDPARQSDETALDGPIDGTQAEEARPETIESEQTVDRVIEAEDAPVPVEQTDDQILQDSIAAPSEFVEEFQNPQSDVPIDTAADRAEPKINETSTEQEVPLTAAQKKKAKKDKKKRKSAGVDENAPASSLETGSETVPAEQTPADAGSITEPAVSTEQINVETPAEDQASPVSDKERTLPGPEGEAAKEEPPALAIDDPVAQSQSETREVPQYDEAPAAESTETTKPTFETEEQSVPEVNPEAQPEAEPVADADADAEPEAKLTPAQKKKAKKDKKKKQKQTSTPSNDIEEPVQTGEETQSENILGEPVPVADKEKNLVEPAAEATKEDPVPVEDEPIGDTRTGLTEVIGDGMAPASEAAEATESVQVPEVTEVAQPAETTESAEATQPGETTQPTEIIESTGPITTTEPTEAIESTEVIEPTEIFEPAEVTQPAEVVEPIEITEPTEATETTEVIETAETVEPAKASQLAEVVEPIEITEVTEPVNLSETAESIQPTEPAAEIADQPIAEIIQESKAAPEAETPHTPAQKKKAKKDKKKKQKQAEAPSDLEIKSVDPESAELQPNEAADAPLHPRETVEPSKEEDLVAEVDTPAGPAAPVEASVDPEWPSEVPRDGKASSPLDDTITGAGTVEDTRVGAGMPDEPKEDILPSASAHNPEPETVASETRVTIDPAVETTANADLPGPAQTTEESQAPMTAAEKRKAKKAKKKKQQQENKEPESPFTEAADPLDSQEVEPRAQSQSEQPEEPFTSDTAGPSDAHESLEQSKDASQSETPANESEPAHQEDVPTETLMAEDATQASPDAAAPIFGEDAAETDESTKDLKTNGEASSEEPLSLIHDATLEDKEPQTLLAEEPPAAVEVPLTAAQKKKAKKDKNKQEKKLSLQADEQDSPASDIPPIEQSEVTEEANATPEVNVPEVDPTTEGSVPAEVVASQGETLPAVTADVPAEAQTEEAKDTAAEEPAIPELDAEPTVETTDVSPPEDTDAATQSAEISEPIEKSEQDSVLPNASSEPPAAQPPSDADPAIYLLDSCSPTAPEDADTISAPEAKEPPSEPEVQAQPEPIEAVTPTTKKEKKKKKKKGKSSSVDEESQSQAANGEDDLQLGDDANVVTAQPVQVTSSDDAPVTYSDKPVISDEPLLNNEDSALSAAAEPEATITEFSEPAAEIVELKQSAEDQPTTTTEPLLNNENSTPSALAEPEATITEFSESIADIGQPESSAEVQFTTTTELPHEGFGTNDASLQDQDREDAKDSIEKAETEAPMTAAQKRKAKKDKKKRKSVAVEEASTGDQADSQLEMEQAPNAESSEAQDDTTGQAAVDQEAGEAEKVAEVHASETVSGHDSTFGTIATDSASPSAEPPLLEVIDEGVTAQPDTVSEPKEYSLPEPGGEEPEPPKSENHLETVSDATNIVDDSPKTSEEAHSRLDNALPESPADDGLSAKERRKLKKKEKKKSKSADPGEDASSPILPAKDIDVGPEQSQPKPVMVSTTQEPTTDQNNANDGQTSDSLNIDQIGEVQEADEALQPSESHVLDPETSSAAVAEQPTASEQADVHLKEPSPIVESLGQTAEQTTDEPSLTAKEKRKLKKKEKKRQSKALDPDDVPPSSPVAEPQYAPHESKQPDETEFSSRDIAEPVTASSPAEKDGKELQSHDKEAPVTPENELASTDEFLSSQVEQPQPEAESFDEVARPEIMGVTEAEEKREDVQQDEDTHSFAQQSEHQQSGEGEIAENDVSLFKEEGALNSETPVSTEENVREESAQAQPAITVEEELPAETQAADVARVEHVEEPALSKKQKKKDKKKNNNKAQAPDEDSIPTTPSMSLVAEAQSEPIPEHIEESSPHPAVEQSPVVEQHSTAAPMHSSDRALEDKENDKATEALQTNQTADEDRDPPGTDQVAFQTEPPAGELPSTERSIEADKEMNFEDLPSQQDEKEEASENSKHEYDQPVVPDGSTLLYHSQGEDAVAKQDEIPAEPPNEHFTDTVQQDEQAVEINPTSNEEIQPEISEAAIVSTPAPQGNEPQDTVADHTSLDAFDQDERAVPEPSGSPEVAEAHSSAGEQAAEAEAPSKKKKLSKKEKKALAAAAAAAAAALEAETSTIEQPQPEVLAEPVPQMETSDQLPDDNSKDEPPQAIDSRLIVQIPEKEHKIDNEKTQNESGFEVIEATALGELDLERQNVDEAKSAEQAPVELVFEDSVPKLTVPEERTAEDMAIDAPMLERPDVEIHEPASQEVINYLVDSAAKQDEFEEPQIHEAAVEESQLLQSVTDEPAVSVEHLGSREPQVNEMTQEKLHTEEPTITDSVIEPSMIQGSPAPDPALDRKLSKKEKRMLKKQAEANIDGEPQQSDEAPPDLSAATPAVKVSDPYLSNLAEVTALNGNTEPVGLLTEPHKEAEVTTTQQTEPASGYSRSDAIPPTEDSSIVPTGESNLAKKRSVEAEDAPLSKKLSKKQKRKAKKNTASEISEQKSNDVASSSTTATAIGDTDAEQSRILDNDATAPSTEPEQPKLQEQKQPQDITRDADPASQGSENTFGKNPPVSDWRPADASYQTPSDAQEVEVEPEVIPSLPQITSVTNAEQASRASDTISLNEQATQQAPHPATDISDETKNVPTTAELEKKGDDEEWPVIEWGDGQGHEDEPSIERAPEPENVTPMPEAETIEEFDESAIPSALQEAWTEPQQDLAQSQEELSPSPPTLSKKDKKKAKKNKRKSEQAAALGGDGHASGNDPDRALEPDSDNTQKIIQTSKEPELETEAPARTTTPGGSKIASLFPELERSGFRRSALDKDVLSPKDQAEDETVPAIQIDRDIAISVSEAPQATAKLHEKLNSIPDVDSQTELQASTAADAAKQANAGHVPSLPEEVELQDGGTSPEQLPPLMDPSRSMNVLDTTSPRRLLPSQMDNAPESPCGLRRTPSVIRGRHQQTPRMWNLEESKESFDATPTASSSPPRSLFGGPREEAHSRPRTPLDPIAEQPGDGHTPAPGRGGTPRLEMKPEHVLPRPHTPVRKFTDNAIAREAWPTPEKDRLGSSPSLDDLLKATQSGGEPSPALTQTPEQGMPVLKPSSSKGKLRRTNRSTSSDLRGASKALDSSQPSPSLDLAQLPSSSSYDPVTDKGKRPLRNMSDVYVSVS